MFHYGKQKNISLAICDTDILMATEIFWRDNSNSTNRNTWDWKFLFSSNLFLCRYYRGVYYNCLVIDRLFLSSWHMESMYGIRNATPLKSTGFCSRSYFTWSFLIFISCYKRTKLNINNTNQYSGSNLTPNAK
jgi:hypothetical protein